MTVGGDISWREHQELLKKCTCVMVMGEVYPPTLEDRIFMAKQYFDTLLKKIFKG